ncbi:PREDICTED: trypsin-1-like [Nicrophorus vespilloides]|uniref:Trypsin-1-like n=1 Tax=Nicrophorus vespilloides TaxID=110193 RepID=A0ABM1MRZ7_NICVS|nr:PREDICTED: trypsin-1-like [Nicrophorus vespilloides]
MCGMYIAVCLVAFFACCYAAPNKYIIGGEVVQDIKAEFPYQVSVQWGDFGSYYHMCGGAIIGPKHVLTARHCCEKYKKEQLFVVVNEDNVIIENKNDKKLVGVNEKFFNDEINTGAVPPENEEEHDLCVLEVKEDLTTTLGGEVISMSDPDDPDDPINDPLKKFTLTGWGITSDSSEIMGDALTKASELSILKRKPKSTLFEDQAYVVKEGEDTDTCEYVLTHLGFSADLLKDNQICTKTKDDTTILTTCKGDSGGPLVYYDQDPEKRILEGIVSWGIYPCGRAGIPNIYTKIAPYKKSIDAIMQ